MTIDNTDIEHLAGEFRRTLPEFTGFALELRREFHRHPRVSGDESDTRERFAEATGVVFDEVASTGGIARIGPATGPTIAVRGELDALPVSESTGMNWASTNGAMHACGHDVHLAALAAVTLAAQRLDLPYGLVAVLQPREEAYPSGAKDIEESGVLDRFDVAHVIGAHVHPRVPRGCVATGAGAVNAAAGEVDIVLRGQGGHGAYPHQAADVVAALSSIALGLPELVRRNVDPLAPALFSVGRLIADAGAANVLPHRGRLVATIRTSSSEDTSRLEHAVKSFVDGTANAYGLEATTTVTRGEPVLSNDAILAAGIERLLPTFGLEPSEPMRSLGSDDFSFFSAQRPSIMSFVGVGDPDDPMRGPALHDATFLPDDDAVMRVANTMTAGYLAAAQGLVTGGRAPNSLAPAPRPTE